MANDQQKEGINTKLIAAIVVAAILVAGVGFVVLSTGGLLSGIGNAGNGNQQVSELSAAENVVKIPVSKITTTLSFYTYNSNGTAIKFFAVKGTDGNVHAAFDTCDVCGPKGYKQSGDNVVCLNCGKQFAINDIGTANVNGGCWPNHLSMSINGDSLVIKTSDLVTKESVFKK
jgi:uncharacterized membrane protein